jgi:hypothetical protein
MQTDWIKIMKETGKLKLSFWNYVNHYFIVVFVLLIPIFSLVSVFEIYVTKTYDGVRPASELLSFSLPWIIPAVLFFFIQKNQLKFKKFNIQYTDDEFKEAIDRTVKELEWRIERNNKTYVRAHRPWNWTGSWGEMITIIRLKDGLLINSIGDPDAWGSGLGYGWNRKNIRIFLKNLSDVKNRIPFKEIIEVQENEWSLKRIVVRLFMYPLCLGLIAVGLFVIANPTNWKSQGAGLAAIVFACYYLYADIKLINEQKKARKHNKL